MNILERFPFELILDIPSQAGIFTLNIEIYSQIDQVDSVEAADEFIDLFVQSVSLQFYSTNASSRLTISSRYFDKTKSAYCYEMRAEAIDPMAYAVLLSLLHQAFLLEEPIRKVAIATDFQAPRIENLTVLAECFYAIELPQSNLPFEVEWNDPEPENTGFDVLIEFEAALSDSNFEKLVQSLVLLDNIMFMYGFRFDLDDQPVFFPRPGEINRLSTTTVTYTSEFKECSQFYYCLFNFLRAEHHSGTTINVVVVE